MSKRIRGTIGASGNITITFGSVDYILSVVRASDGTYDAALPIALSNLMSNGGNAVVSYAGQTVNVTVPGGNTVVTPVGVGVVGQSPPTYSGSATLPAIPTSDGAALSQSHYGNGQVEFFWKAAVLFNEGAGDKYQLVIDNVVRYIGIGHSHLRNGFSYQSHTASVRIVRANGEFGPATSINFNVS